MLLNFLLFACGALTLASASTPQELTGENFDSAVNQGNYFVVFYTDWCEYSQKYDSVLEEVAKQLGSKDNVHVGKVNCDQEADLCAKYAPEGYPTSVLFVEGLDKYERYLGAREKSEVIEFLNAKLKDVDITDGDDNEIDDEQEKPVRGELIELTEDSFAKHVSTGNHFVKFFAPWCSHCQRLAPTWDQLAKSLKDNHAVTIAKIDCTLYRPICQDFEVKGYPTLLWIEDGKKIEKYSGSRDHDQLKAYVEKMLGTEMQLCPPKKQEDQPSKVEATKPEVLQLLAGDFADTVAQGITFVKFYAPWCGHCQKLSPIWDQLAEKVHDEKSGVKIAKVDCTVAENRELCVSEEVEGYPTLFAYKDGEKQSEYHGSRSLAELQSYIKKFIGHDEL